MLSVDCVRRHNGMMECVRTNVANRLAGVAAGMRDAIAVAQPYGRHVVGQNSYATCTFGELNDDATALARGLVDLGVEPGTRLVLLVTPGIEFVKLVYALLRSGATTVLVDPGMGPKHLLNCLMATAPAGFVGVPRAHAARMFYKRRFRNASINVTLGRRWFWGGVTYKQLLERGRASRTTLPRTHADDPAAIIFTSGSTGPPKGVLYTHRMFDAQAAAIQRQYGIQPGGVDLACFALFGLFNSTMGVTTVFPDMDFSRPAYADPRKLAAAANDWQITQAFASPAVWDRVGAHCEATGNRIKSLRQVFSCGASVPQALLRCTLACVHPDAKMHTPYGATESLPVSTIEAEEVFEAAAEPGRSEAPGGVCVGRKFDSVDWKVIEITDEPIRTIGDAVELAAGEIGELIVRSPQTSPAYVVDLSASSTIGRAGGVWHLSDGDISGQGAYAPRSPDANSLAKIDDDGTVWHRMGDVGYFDDSGRFWYCGRKSQRVESRWGSLFTECAEAVFNGHPAVRRSALVGIGPRLELLPVIVVELAAHAPPWPGLVDELRQMAAADAHAWPVMCFLKYPGALPVDVRHNAKINREALAAWAAKTLAKEDSRHVTALLPARAASQTRQRDAAG